MDYINYFNQIDRIHPCGLLNLKKMNRWNIIDKWVITDVKTDEPIILYDGTFIEVTNFLNKFYEDGRVDVETYENWLNRQ